MKFSFAERGIFVLIQLYLGLPKAEHAIGEPEDLWVWGRKGVKAKECEGERV